MIFLRQNSLSNPNLCKVRVRKKVEQALGNDSEFLDTNCGKFSYDITFRLNVVKTNCPERQDTAR